MMSLVTNNRESDGRFALRLDTKKSFEADNQRVAARRQREAQLVTENAEWCQRMGYDPNLAAEIFA